MRLNVEVDDATYELFKSLASKRGMSVSGAIRIMLDAHIERWKKEDCNERAELRRED